MPDNELWLMPFHFWTVILFILGCIVGSFLNVCIYRMPRGESIVHPPSHCPHCGYHIPWYLNVPLFTWLWLRGRCAHCQAPITVRYFVVELLTGIAFLSCWLGFGRYSIGLALCYCVLLGGLLVATFIDFEHFIIPDEITVGGIVVGFLLSFFVPALHHAASVPASLKQSALGIGVGAAALYTVLRLGKLAFGKQQFQLPPDSKVVFTETSLQLPDQEIPFDELFYRQSDTVVQVRPDGRTAMGKCGGEAEPIAPADWGGAVQSRGRAAPGGGDGPGGDTPGSDGLGRREVHRGHRGLPGMAGGLVLPDA
jgi:leader peptidase (prepilin peptidase)/N-methyltransferase